ncbi:MAG: PH domain-containing protein, partial [Candidatus Kapaibacterium sp.]
PILMDGETIEHAYKLIRDQLIFTNKRVITIDKQGITGIKQNIRSIPYKSIKMISKEGAGMLDLDAELVLWITGESQPLKFEFKKGVDINQVYRLISQHIL